MYREAFGSSHDLMSELSVQTRRLVGVASWHMSGANRARLAARAWTLMAFGTALLVFAITAAPDLTWAHGGYDGGELITASYTLGIPHPPGYPTYVFLGKLFSGLPVGTIAFRFHLFSAAAAALAVALLARTLMSSGQRLLTPPAAAAIAVGVALLPPVWSQATIAEVYGLNLALVAAAVFALLVLKRPFVTGICLGLALTTHTTSLLLIPLMLLLTPRAGWPRMAAGFAIGLLPLLFLPWLATTGSPVTWGNPTTATGWWWLVSGRLYAANLALPTLDSLLASPALIGSAMVALVAAIVAVRARSARASTLSTQDNRMVGLLSLTAAAYASFALLYRVPDADVFLLPAFLLLALAAAPVVGRAGRWLWLLPVILLVVGWNQHNLRDDVTVRSWAESLLASAPESAILLTPGDRTIFTLWYFQHVEGQRTDVTLVDENLFAFDWYRAQLGRDVYSLAATADDDLALFATTNGTTRPVCHAGLVGPDGQPSVRLTCEALSE